MDTPDTSINVALEHFGLGPIAGEQETVYVAAVIDRLTETSVVLDVISPSLYGSPVKRCEFIRTLISAEFYEPMAALVQIPKTFLPIFVLWDFVLPEQFINRYRDRIAMHNAPYLPPDSGRRSERIGSVRI